ncbi:MAG: right-handed parallel beta-helix repeat-containing protein [Clostridia bacterium]|nr:right-handed parallel beta-helix repeat-containing protein [Clostridia bacterium]
MVLYVNIAAERDGNGSESAPFRHINDAARVARPGDEVIVAPGIYREYVNPIHAGLEDARITYRSEVPLGATITGAEVADKWKKFRKNVWVLRVSNSVFGEYNPYKTLIMGDWYSGEFVFHTGAVYLNGKMLYEATSLKECQKGDKYLPSWDPEFSVYKWYTEQDEATDETVIYANFQDVDPNEECVEINVRRNCFMPSETGINYITLSGFNINKAATTWAPPAAYQDGMVGPHWSKGWIIEDCELSNSRCCGISLGKYYDEVNDHFFTYKHVKTPTQMERDAVCRGQYHGWLKENIGSHIIRRCNIHDCEQTGIVGRMGAVFSTIEDNHIHHINNMQQLAGAEIAGIKLHAAIDVTFRRNHIHHSTMGIWCDWQAQGTRITQNFLHDNQIPETSAVNDVWSVNEDIFIEVSHGPTLIDNNVLLSQQALRLPTQGVAVVHNLILGSITSIGENTGHPGRNEEARYTPYHIQHRTEVAGFMTILHGDDRFYNNIFVQYWNPAKVKSFSKENYQVGTFVFDEDNYPTYEEWISWFEMDKPYVNMAEKAQYHFSHLPIWSCGNAFFGGARPWKNEKDALVDTRHKVRFELEEELDGLHIDTNLYDLLGNFTDHMISSDTLGKAFEPDQRFENPDGTPITFDRDYFGSSRGLRPIPGPFASADELDKPLC